MVRYFFFKGCKMANHFSFFVFWVVFSYLLCFCSEQVVGFSCLPLFLLVANVVRLFAVIVFSHCCRCCWRELLFVDADSYAMLHTAGAAPQRGKTHLVLFV